VHRTNSDIPETIIKGLNELGGFGLSVPEEFGGFANGGESEYLGMVIATEELSWGGLGIGGSLITRPEIMTRALLSGGTQAQKERWLPRLANAEVLAAIAVTEPDFGSDVASISTTATKSAGGWLLNGTKTWCTFAARANVLVLLARSDPDRAQSHRGLSLFLVERSRVIPRASSTPRTPMAKVAATATDDSRATHRHVGLPRHALLRTELRELVRARREPSGRGRGPGQGFYFQMAGFENGRLQTAARAVGVMQAAYEAALEYARSRKVFGEPIINYELTRVKLGTMAAIIQCSRQFSFEVARLMGNGAGTMEASMAKAYVCRAAEWVTREAMQIHGGMGYARSTP